MANSIFPCKILIVLKFSFLLLIFMTPCIRNLCKCAYRSRNSNSDITATAKFYFDGFYRRFAFPPRTYLIITPSLTIPAWRDRIESKHDSYLTCDDQLVEQEEEGFGTAFKNSDVHIESPFYVYFDKLGWTHENSIYNTPSHVAPFLQEYFVNPTLQIFGVPPGRQTGRKDDKKEKKNKTSNRKTITLSESHRLQMFRKVESLLEELGVGDGKACLLRAICELHEFPFDTGRFGVVGEILALIFRDLPESSERFGYNGGKCLSIYAAAEKYGKAKECKKYAKYCKHSIFQWYWNMPHVGTTKRH